MPQGTLLADRSTADSGAGPVPCAAEPAVSADSSELEVRPIVLERRTGWAPVNVRELWRFRELMYFLIWRDVKVRYKQTVLGVAWAVLVPVLSVTIFTVIFGNFAGLKNTLPSSLADAYPVFAYAGLIPWLLFSNAISLGGMSLVNQQQLLTKVYFPRLFVPAATVTGAVIDLAISLLVFFGLVAVYAVPVSAGILLLPVFIGLALVASLGIAFLLSALTVHYRDFRFVIPFLVQVWQYVSPVVYPTAIIPPQWRLIYALNPLAGAIEGFRSCIFGLPFDWGVIGVSAAATAALFVLGVAYFRRTERRFADIA
jgi:lipopolysaccharide transport system permease protein